MSKIVKLGVVVAVLGIAALAAIYLAFFSSDSPGEFTLTPIDEATLPELPADVSGTWSVASGSEAGYRVREKLARLQAKSDAVGRTSEVTGTTEIEGTTVKSASFEVSLATLKSDEDRRDSRARDALQTDQFPTATFMLALPIDIGSSTSATEVIARGDLMIHGVTQLVGIPVEAARNGEKIELVGSITFPMATFGITPPSIGGFVTVEDDATLEFRILLEGGGE